MKVSHNLINIIHFILKESYDYLIITNQWINQLSEVYYLTC